MSDGIQITDPNDPNRKLNLDDMRAQKAAQQSAEQEAAKAVGGRRSEGGGRGLTKELRETGKALNEFNRLGEQMYPDAYEKAKAAQKELTADEIKKKEDRNPPGEKLGKGYSGKKDDDDDSDENGEKPGRLRRAGRRIKKGIKKRKQAAIIGGVMSGLGVAIGVALLSLLPYQLHHIFSNLDANTFARLQGVDVKGRSSKWVQAYMTARLLDIEDSKGNAKPDDNILFRAKRVDYNKQLTDWYRTIRTTKFEQDMFEKHGIKFASMAVREDGQIKIRAAKITIKDTELSFDPFDGPNAIDEKTLEAATNGDIEALERINRLTGKLDEFVHTELFDNKQARKEVKQAVRGMIKNNGFLWWNAVKRYHIRKDIQNMTGITDWKFFETTRERWKEKRVSVRNKLIAKALPANAKSGKFLRCMFGIDTCRASTDPASPDNRNLPVDGKNAGADKTDKDGNPISPDTSSLESGIKPDAELGDTAKKIASSLLKKASLATGVVGFISSLAIFDENVNNHTFSTMVQVARSEQVGALYASMAIANDQLRTGEAVGDEVDEFMGMVENTTNTEAWETGINDRPNVVLAAGEFVPASNKKEFCSEEHQAMMEKPEFFKQASNEFYHNCDKAGTAKSAQEYEDRWNNGVGSVLHPVLAVWQNTIGFVIDIFNAVFDAIVGPIMNAILSALGLDKKIEEVMGWIGEKILAFSGAGPMWSENSLAGKIVNLLFQGGAVTAEWSTRGQGGAETTPEMEKTTTERYIEDRVEANQERSFYDRYFALDDPDSVAANAVFALVNKSPASIGRSLMSSMGSIFTLPFSLFSKTASAADGDLGTPYTIARKIAGIQTYDFPADRCLDRDLIGAAKPKVVGTGPSGPVYGNGSGSEGLKEPMTPQNATNAADPDIDLFEPDELNWDLMSDKDRWYNELYNRAGDDTDKLNKIKKVWNCALLDNAVAGGMGGLYGYKGVGAISSSSKVRE